MSPDPDDDALLRAFAGGDARAFDRLYQRHRAPLYRFVRRLLGTALAAQADEVFQDTWLKVIQSAARWQPQGATFRTWLFTLAHHRAVDCLRISGRELSRDALQADADGWSHEGTPWLEWPEASEAPGPAEQAFWRAAGERLLACLDELPAPQKVVFLLHHDEEIGVDELARALAIGFETAKSRLRYAMNKLRTCMGAYLPAPVRP